MMTLLSWLNPVLLILDYAGTFREERGNCTLICSWERKRRKKERERTRGGGTLFFGNESGSREREPTAGEIVQLASPH